MFDYALSKKPPFPKKVMKKLFTMWIFPNLLIECKSQQNCWLTLYFYGGINLARRSLLFVYTKCKYLKANDYFCSKMGTLMTKLCGRKRLMCTTWQLLLRVKTFVKSSKNLFSKVAAFCDFFNVFNFGVLWQCCDHKRFSLRFVF